jgi:hypothetical protein
MISPKLIDTFLEIKQSHFLLINICKHIMVADINKGSHLLGHILTKSSSQFKENLVTLNIECLESFGEFSFGIYFVNYICSCSLSDLSIDKVLSK